MTTHPPDRPAAADGGDLPTYAGSALRHVAMPLGGIGTGQIAIGGDGGLRQWQIVNQINHLGFVPHSFFAVRASCIEPPLDVLRVLQSREVIDLPPDPTPLVTDDGIPPDQRALIDTFPGVERTVFSGLYPFARLAYHDGALPVEVSLEASSPFVPLDAAASGLPAIRFDFRLRNRWPHPIHGALCGTLQNAVGWDGVTPIAGNRCPLYGGNTNRVRHLADRTTLAMENPSLPDDHPGAGQMALTALGGDVRVYERWTDPAQFRRFMEGFNPARTAAGDDAKERASRNRPEAPYGPSPSGTTWNGGLLVPFRLEPGGETSVSFLVAWCFPNRYVNFDQPGPPRAYGRSRFWLGNAYAARVGDAVGASDRLAERGGGLDDASRRWEGALRGSTLPGWLTEALAAQGSLIRSPTCFWTEDDKFFGFEGSLGASTAMWNGSFGGSCPLNCTHVWNYEWALASLFPRLERTMRETDLDHVQAPAGYVPHRTRLPLYLRQLWDEPIGGPTNPALDGMLGTVLKVYREVRRGAGREWLARYWPRVDRLMAYIVETWDGDGDGVLQGEQPNTYDIAFYGPNMYIGGLWLAALRAAEELARLAGDDGKAGGFRDRFERASARYDELLWNGEYYVQLLDESTPREDQFGDGCLADQLFGQWWAHLLDLGHLLPEEHVKTTLRSVVRHNLRRGFGGFEHGYRVFADRDDVGLLVCTWPHGGRPQVPVRYCDEVWTGIEYQVGAHCIMEGLRDEGLEILAALRGRYDGRRRNPYNEIECGDHYARAMAGWSVLEAISGQRYDATRDRLGFDPADHSQEFRAPYVTAAGWGSFARSRHDHGDRVDLSCAFGEVRLREIALGGLRPGAVRVSVGGQPLAAEARWEGETATLVFAEAVTVQDGAALRVDVGR